MLLGATFWGGGKSCGVEGGQLLFAAGSADVLVVLTAELAGVYFAGASCAGEPYERDEEGSIRKVNCRQGVGAAQIAQCVSTVPDKTFA